MGPCTADDNIRGIQELRYRSKTTDLGLGCGRGILHQNLR